MATYLALLALAWQSGYALRVPWDYFQLLPQTALIDDLSRSLYYLHSQPPLMNLELGLVLKLARVLGLHQNIVLLGFHITLGGVAVYGYSRLCQYLLVHRWLRRIAIAVFVLSPVLYMTLFEFFYTFHELVILSVLPLAVFFYARTRSTFDYGCICFGVVLLVGTHALFHFVWGLVVLAALPLICLHRSQKTPQRLTLPRRQIAWFVVSAFLLLAWPLKNGLLFDSFHASSWGGYSMALELPVDIQRLPPRNWDVPERFASTPVVANRFKYGRKPNWNHYSIIQHSKNQGALAMQTLAENPLSLAQKARLNYWNYTRFSGRNPYTGAFGISPSSFPENLTPWMQAYEAIVFQDPRVRDELAHRAYRTTTRQSWAVSGFVFVFPLILIGAAVAIVRTRTTSPAENRTALFMLFCVVWVLTATLLIDGSEANRIRFSTEPYLFLLAFWSLDRLFLRKDSPGTPELESS